MGSNEPLDVLARGDVIGPRVGRPCDRESPQRIQQLAKPPRWDRERRVHRADPLGVIVGRVGAANQLRWSVLTSSATSGEAAGYEQNLQENGQPLIDS